MKGVLSGGHVTSYELHREGDWVNMFNDSIHVKEAEELEQEKTVPVNVHGTKGGAWSLFA